MSVETRNAIIDFLGHYDDEYNSGNLYLGAESYSIQTVDSLLNDDEFDDLPEKLAHCFEDIWDDRIDGKTLLGVDSRTTNDVGMIRRIMSNQYQNN